MTIDTAFARFPSLTTDRLLLRQIQPGDAEALFAILSDDESMEFYGNEPHQSLDDTRELIRQIQARYAQRKTGNVDQGVDFAAKQIPEGDFQVALKHDCSISMHFQTPN